MVYTLGAPKTHSEPVLVLAETPTQKAQDPLRSRRVDPKPKTPSPQTTAEQLAIEQAKT